MFTVFLQDAFRKFKGPEGYAKLDFVPTNVQARLAMLNCVLGGCSQQMQLLTGPLPNPLPVLPMAACVCESEGQFVSQWLPARTPVPPCRICEQHIHAHAVALLLPALVL